MKWVWYPSPLFCNDSHFPAGRDYTTTSGNLTFAGNQSHHNISISLVEDGEVEGDEEFFVMLSIPDFDQKVQLKNPNFTITIMDSSNG